MSTYKVKHLHSDTSYERPRIHLNTSQQPRAWTQETDPAIENFHRQLPDYGPTALHSLPSVASELGFSHVFVKDESTRFGLPSFKILGASWAIHQTLCKYLDLPSCTTLAELTQALKGRDDVSLVTTTEGNWGRACARMGKYLGVPVRIYVPYFMNPYTSDLISGEGAKVIKLEGGSYDDCLGVVRKEAEEGKGLMVLDTSWEGFTEIPQWVTDGYSTMLRETDRQVSAATSGKTATLAFASVGVGSWAHAVVSHYKSTSAANKIVTVEPDLSASFKESLHCDSITSIQTGDTIMAGMCCGTSSMIAWPVLRDGTFAAVAVTEKQSHEAVQFLQSQGVNSGPCGAANLTALRTLCEGDEFISRGERGNVVVVLFSTEGMREYEVPN